jgi:hypothetical protein
MLEIDIDKYDLIAIGEFSYGFNEIWEFRYKMLKKLIRTTNKPVTIFCEIYEWQAYNLMHKMYLNDNNEKVDCDNILFSRHIIKHKLRPPKGELYNYVPYIIESQIFHKILKYIIRHQNRINVVGIMPDKEKEKVADNEIDEYMFGKIKRVLNTLHINILWAHNHYIDNRKSVHDKKVKSCGHHLKNKYKNKYCVILSQAYEGNLRWDSFYLGHTSKKHIWERHHFYKEFNFNSHKQWIHVNTLPGTHHHIYDNFKGDFIEFGDGYYESNVYGYDVIVKSCDWDYVIFWNYVNPLTPMRGY